MAARPMKIAAMPASCRASSDLVQQHNAEQDRADRDKKRHDQRIGRAGPRDQTRK